MNKTVQINYCRKVLCVTAYPCVLTSVPLTYVGAFGFVGFILFFSAFRIFGMFMFVPALWPAAQVLGRVSWGSRRIVAVTWQGAA